MAANLDDAEHTKERTVARVLLLLLRMLAVLGIRAPRIRLVLDNVVTGITESPPQKSTPLATSPLHTPIPPTIDVVGTEEFRYDWLKKEVDILERKIEFYDEISSRIKNWTVVSWFALVSYAITNNQARVAYFSPLIPFFFLLIDASFKRYQIEFIRRTRLIMKFLNTPDLRRDWFTTEGALLFPIYDLLNIYGHGKKHEPTAQDWGSMLAPMFKASVALLYWCLVILSFLIAWLLHQ